MTCCFGVSGLGIDHSQPPNQRTASSLKLCTAFPWFLFASTSAHSIRESISPKPKSNSHPEGERSEHLVFLLGYLSWHDSSCRYDAVLLSQQCSRNISNSFSISYLGRHRDRCLPPSSILPQANIVGLAVTAFVECWGRGSYWLCGVRRTMPRCGRHIVDQSYSEERQVTASTAGPRLCQHRQEEPDRANPYTYLCVLFRRPKRCGR